jgi:hypothetical protein
MPAVSERLLASLRSSLDEVDALFSDAKATKRKVGPPLVTPRARDLGGPLTRRRRRRRPGPAARAGGPQAAQQRPRLARLPARD